MFSINSVLHTQTSSKWILLVEGRLKFCSLLGWSAVEKKQYFWESKIIA